MRFSTSLALTLAAGAVTNALPAPQDSNVDQSDLPTTASSDPAVASDQVDQLAEYAQQQANATLQDNASKRGSCNIFNVAVRQEWGSLTNTQRKAYTDAVLCLQSKPAKTPASLIPGAKTRFDDWVGTHINQTLTIHYTGTFLSWHRYFTWQYEQALRNECGYKGYQPYWNWAKTAESGLEKSVMLDGSANSMSGNGAYVAGQSDINLGGNGLAALYLPAGTGGGCVKSGPFKDMKVNLGPISLALPGGTTASNGDGLSYNPRCLKRDLTDAVNKRYANGTALARLILQNDNVADFQLKMQGEPGSGDIGVHGGGHFSMGGDPGRDVFTSPGDPLFYLHHGGIDRTWWIWQALDYTKRTGQSGVAGTNTFLNVPPSADTTLDTVIDLGYAGGAPLKISDLMSTTDGPFCYIYV